jgi:hypothetical protein
MDLQALAGDDDPVRRECLRWPRNRMPTSARALIQIKHGCPLEV